jgi:hypothetical protein
VRVSIEHVPTVKAAHVHVSDRDRPRPADLPGTVCPRDRRDREGMRRDRTSEYPVDALSRTLHTHARERTSDLRQDRSGSTSAGKLSSNG